MSILMGIIYISLMSYMDDALVFMFWCRQYWWVFPLLVVFKGYGGIVFRGGDTGSFLLLFKSCSCLCHVLWSFRYICCRLFDGFVFFLFVYLPFRCVPISCLAVLFLNLNCISLSTVARVLATIYFSDFPTCTHIFLVWIFPIGEHYLGYW